mgnify:CR=1 FL=1
MACDLNKQTMRFHKAILLGTLCLISQISLAQFADESVLRTGNWYKIGIVETGIYRLDQSFFSNLGISPGSIDPRNIRIYGNGGSMLPQENDAPRHDDLIENAIYVAGEADGSFNAGDHVLFYGEGPHGWRYNAESQLFRHEYHLYADTNYYFLTIADLPGKRIDERPSASAPNYTPAGGRAFYFHELDRENPIHSGRHWLGEKFDLIRERTFSFHVPDALPGGQIRLNLRLAARSDKLTSFIVSARNNVIGTVSINSTSVNNSESTYYKFNQSSYLLSPASLDGDSLRIKLEYNKAGSSRSEGWLDWIEIDYDQAFNTAQRNQFFFGLATGTGAGAVASVSVANGAADYRIWDITQPTQVAQQQYTLGGSSMDFAVDASSIRRFIAFKGGFRSPASAVSIANQNLHGLELADYLIIAYPGFRAAAELLADFHQSHYGRTVRIVYPYQIYHEFSSGKRDVSAIRDFIRMFYERSGGALPGFVMMLGDGSYDYKNINKWTTVKNFVPTYQSRDSWDPTDSYTSDDFFVMLDPGEGYWGENSGIDGDVSYQVNRLDAAIGRLPVETPAEALAAVNKIIRYATDAAGIGSWRNQILLVADYKDNEAIHMIQADAYTSQINGADPCYNIDKVYMDNYRMLRTADGTQFPDGRAALINSLNEGYLIVNYTGHGGEAAWSNSSILELPDIQAMTNFNRLPVVVTATCEFGRYDNPDRRTGAEMMLAKAEGGAIALFTTVRLVYSSPNATLNANFYREVFQYDADNHRMPALGEIMARTKNRTFVAGNLANINSRNFTLLGDPGLIMSYPQLRAAITEFNGQPVGGSGGDTLQSLSRVRVRGEVRDAENHFISDYNGQLAVSVFDKPSKFITREAKWAFLWQKNRIFKGTATVENGVFEFEFVVPIDISYEEGSGKISVYFSNDETDGAGCYSDFAIGGTDPNALPDLTGPEIRLFINDSTWKDGGTVGPDPYLYAIVSDENGINTVASGIGHEMIAILDEDERNILILNDYYEARPNSYQEGTVYYQLKDIETGEHTLRMRVWDVVNNFSEATTRFIVSENAFMALGQILNVPNPVGDGGTAFWVNHNRPGRQFSVSVDIFTTDGRQVASLEDTFFAEGNTYKGLTWDGRSGDGNPIANGFYVYHVIVTDVATGSKAGQVEKLVLIR